MTKPTDWSAITYPVRVVCVDDAGARGIFQRGDVYTAVQLNEKQRTLGFVSALGKKYAGDVGRFRLVRPMPEPRPSTAHHYANDPTAGIF